ncbi:NAD(P)/FAD-dependent oxidoreductase [Caulobacter sp. S45]|uniref:phytoene desaturase family protein n=1 Tax=Caulobacter sp. S45 TaxID=1641861 RepID=UPI001575D0F9|nr:NAD(P)/FAD-dependent oxidoreductase [Caulobacter sp. S45]
MTGLPDRRELVKAAVAAPMLLAGLGREAVAAPPSSPRPPLPSDRFHYVVAGAGHNSLICAAYLAKAGYRVLVVEGQPEIGGGCKTTERLLPGFKEDWCSATHGLIASNPLVSHDELRLEQYGYEILRPDVVMHYPFGDGASFTIFRGDLERSAATIAQVSKADAETFRRMAALKSAAAAGDALAASYMKTLGQMSGYAAARQVWRSPHLQAAALAGGRFSGVSGSDFGTGSQSLSMMANLEGRPFPRGGSGMLAIALGRYIKAHGGVVLTRMPVTGLILEAGRCRGVECADGRRFRAETAVVSTLHPKHLVAMAPAALWGEAFTQQVDLMQSELGMFVVHCALTEPPRYPLASGGTMLTPEAAAMEDPASIFVPDRDAAEGELHLADYPLQVCHQSAFDPTRVPPGCGSVKVQGYVTYDLKGGPARWDEIKDQVADTVMSRYMKLTANLTPDKVLARHIVSPLDIERGNASMWRSNVHGFDKRAGGFFPYRLPISGLYQTGDCTAPGGGISGLPGRNAAEVILKDQGRSLDQVVASAT